jgi:hypothetical protein
VAAQYACKECVKLLLHTSGVDVNAVNGENVLLLFFNPHFIWQWLAEGSQMWHFYYLTKG